MNPGAPASPTCPACGSTNVEPCTYERSYKPPFGTEHRCEFPMLACRTCFEAWAADTADQLHQAMIDQANQEEVCLILDELESRGLTLAYLARALRLHFDTATTWRTKASPELAALLRVVRQFPWILQVADSNYRPSVVNLILESVAKKQERP